jgi:DNA topoisomerase-6 subunit B
MSKTASAKAKKRASGRGGGDAEPAEDGPVASAPAARNSSSRAPRETAECMAGKQREIAVSEFFAKNRHLLGFDNPRKALLTTVKEAVDNSLDACEEGGILPEIWIKIEALNARASSAAKAEDKDGGEKPDKSSKRGGKTDNGQATLIAAPPAPGGIAPAPPVAPSISSATRFRVTVRDNGPGIVKAQIPNVFGRLLYGSKFHRLRMSRGQQGIGISAAGMYGLLTTGQSVQIVSRTGKRKPAHRFELQMDTQKNRPEIIADHELSSWAIPDDEAWGTNAGQEMHSGTEVAIVIEARFQRGRASVDEYLEQTAIANPHAAIHWIAPDGQVRHFPREVTKVPDSPDAIKPHPYGVELGVLIRMLKETMHRKLGAFLQEEFSRVSPKVAKEICQKAGLTTQTWCAQVAREEADRLHAAIQQTRIIAPPTNCLVPIGPQQILKGLLKEIKAEFYTAETREPAVYRGNPFQIEVGIAFGGALPVEESARVIRFANRVPLLYQPSSCAITKSVIDTGWKNYGISQPRNSLPEGPLVIFVHMASVWVPFTSESKEAIADYDEIRKEMKLALQECGRKLMTYVRKRQRIAREQARRGIFEKYVGEVINAISKIRGLPQKRQQELYKLMMETAKKRTLQADMELDEDGKPIDPRKRPKEPKDANVVVIESAAPSPAGLDAPSTAQESRAAGGEHGRAKSARRTTSNPPSAARRSRKAASAVPPRARGKRGRDDRQGRLFDSED